MGKVKLPAPVKLITGFIFRQTSAFVQSRSLLEKHFGKVDFESPLLPFIYTDYYEKEIGKDLKRKFVAFQKLVDPAILPKVKTYTNRIEKRFTRHDGLRLINIDPGYLDLSKLILATTKDYNHRIYLEKGIYAEVTLSYQNKTFCPWDWTYPDYRTPQYLDIFNQIRQIYSQQKR